MEISQALNISSGIFAFTSASAYAVQIHLMKIKTNVATWGMVLLLDVIGLVLVLKSGNEKPLMQLGWVGAAILIFVASIINRGNWKWGKIETYATCCCAASVAWWIIAWRLGSNPAWSIFGYVVAFGVSLWPQVEQYWNDPLDARKSAWLWLVSSVAIILGLLSIPNMSPEYSIVPICFLAINLGVSFVTLRKSS